MRTPSQATKRAQIMVIAPIYEEYYVQDVADYDKLTEHDVKHIKARIHNQCFWDKNMHLRVRAMQRCLDSLHSASLKPVADAIQKVMNLMGVPQGDSEVYDDAPCSVKEAIYMIEECLEKSTPLPATFNTANGEEAYKNELEFAKLVQVIFEATIRE